MMVSSRIVKPHMVKKWAVPGTVHLRSLRWPATSVTSASARGTDASPGPVGRRLAGTDEARQPVEAAAGDDDGDDRDG